MSQFIPIVLVYTNCLISGKGLRVVDLSGVPSSLSPEEKAAATKVAMEEGADVIYQARTSYLQSDAWPPTMPPLPLLPTAPPYPSSLPRIIAFNTPCPPHATLPLLPTPP